MFLESVHTPLSTVRYNHLSFIRLKSHIGLEAFRERLFQQLGEHRMEPTRRYLTKDDLRKASNMVEALWNLTYLIREESERPEQIRRYAGMSEERLRILSELLSKARDQDGNTRV